MVRERHALVLLVLFAALTISCQPSGPEIAKQELPSDYVTDRFYVTPVTTHGDSLRFYTDTGGGGNFIFPSVANALELETEPTVINGDTITLTAFPPFQPGASIPAPPGTIPPGDKVAVLRPRGSAHFTGDGFLGSPWFADRVWEFNYPEESLALVTEIRWADRSPQHRIPVRFQTDSSGASRHHYPGITVVVAGDSLDMLFDTGATAFPTAEAARQLDRPGVDAIGTSFIAESLFTKWQDEHPDWRVIPAAERTTEMPMIRVPTIAVAGYQVGPVWFTMRPAGRFAEWMSQWMDRTIYGAVGGSALHYFRIIVDYPNQMAEFSLKKP